MKIENSYIPPGRANRPSTRAVESITIHETDNTNAGADAAAHAKYLATTADKISWHYSVDDKGAVCHVPDGETAWHSGTTAGNQSSIGVEICVNSDGDYEAALKNAAELVRGLLATHGLTVADIKQHYDWNKKNCPRRLREAGRWEEFLDMVSGGRRKRYECREGIHLRYAPVEDFRVLYWDKPKKTSAVRDYANAGFFGGYAETVGGKRVTFTLPVGNLVADITEADVLPVALKYLREWGVVSGGKVRINTREKGTPPSTLIVDAQGLASVQAVSLIRSDTRYAISGAPVIIGGKDASWSKDVLPQGWLSDITRATWHTLLGLLDGYVVTIGMKTTTSNCITSSEAYNRLKGYGFTNVIMLDGGGSFVFDHAGKNVAVTSENRRVNTLIM